MLTPGPNDIALVLPGGGSWITAQAAALEAILQRPSVLSNIKAIYCNSAGSISGVCVAAGIYAGTGTEILKTALASVTENSQIYNPDVMPFLQHPVEHLIDGTELLNGLIFGESALDQEPLWDLLQKYVGTLTAEQVLEKTGIEILVRGFDSRRGVGGIYTGDLWHMAAASSAIECAFMPHLGISDGGPFDNCPVDLALNAGFKKILIVYCGPSGPPVDFTPIPLTSATPAAPKITAISVLEGLLGSITALNESLNEARLLPWEQSGGQLVEAYPAAGVNMGSILDFTPGAAAGRITAGQNAAVLALQQVDKLGW